MIAKIIQNKSTLLDFDKNKENILFEIDKATNQGVKILVFPMFSISGSNPGKLNNYESYKTITKKYLIEIINKIPTGMLIVLDDGFNSISIANKDIIGTSLAGKEYEFIFENKKFCIVPITNLDYYIPTDFDGDYLIAQSNYPYHNGGYFELISVLKTCVAKNILYANSVNILDDYILEGKSTIIKNCVIKSVAKAFEQDFILDNGTPLKVNSFDLLEDKLCAITLTLKNYITKCGFSGAHIGLSGGIDSALTLALLWKILPPENINAFLMPSPYSSAGSVDDSIKMCKGLNIKYTVVKIDDLYKNFINTFQNSFQNLTDLADQCIQSRIRGNILMGYSNCFSSLLIETGNKSEDMTGYCTLYGDTTGGIAPIGDLYKNEVYQLANYFNKDKEIIPQNIIDKAPSAELKPGQKDQDNLPPYEILDKILADYIENHTDREKLIQRYDKETVDRVIKLVKNSQFKRAQIPPVIKLYKSSFLNQFPIIY